MSIPRTVKHSESKFSRYLRTVAIPKAGLSLAILTLGNLLVNILSDNPWFYPLEQQWIITLQWIFALTASYFFAPVVLKFLLHWRLVLEKDFNHPLVCPVSATIWMTLLQFSNYIAAGGESFITVGLLVWVFALVCDVALMLWISWCFILRGFQLSQVFPTWFVGFVGIAVAAATSQVFDLQSLGLPIFWVSFVCYLCMLVVICVRLLRYPLPQAAKPTVAIFAAPLSLLLVAYTTCVEVPNPYFVLGLLVLGQVFYLAVLLRLPQLLRLPFMPSFAAFTFPLVISAASLWRGISVLQSASWQVSDKYYWLALTELLIGALLVFYVAIRFVGAQITRWVGLTNTSSAMG